MKVTASKERSIENRYKAFNNLKESLTMKTNWGNKWFRIGYSDFFVQKNMNGLDFCKMVIDSYEDLESDYLDGYKFGLKDFTLELIKEDCPMSL